MMKLKVIEDAGLSLLSIDTCRQHLELVAIDGDSDAETHPDDALILSMLDAAVSHAESFTGLAIARRTYEMALDDFPRTIACGIAATYANRIDLYRPPFIDLVSFQTGEESDAAEVDANLYVIDDYGDVTSLRPVSAWPVVTAAPNTIRIRYRAGYSSEGDPDTDAKPLPATIRAAVLLLLGHLYENREDSTEKAMQTIPNGFEAILRPLRVLKGFA